MMSIPSHSNNGNGNGVLIGKRIGQDGHMEHVPKLSLQQVTF